MHRKWVFIVLLLLSQLVSADQSGIVNYAKSQKIAYTLYVGVSVSESTDIYCGIKFKVLPGTTGRPTNWLTLEHAFAAQWMVDAVGCTNRVECRKDSNPKTRTRFNHAEADLHNLWPALGNLNSARGDKLFGEIDGDEEREIEVGGRNFSCEFQANRDLVEPRPIVRGNLARSIFYMCKEYGFPVNADMLTVLKKWNRDDPPTSGEKKRNARIEKMQGNRNLFVDRPSRANTLKCAAP